MSKEGEKNKITDAYTALESEYLKEKEICAGANASEYHQKRFAEISKKLGIVQAEKAVEEPETVTTKSDETENVAVEETPEEAS